MRTLVAAAVLALVAATAAALSAAAAGPPPTDDRPLPTISGRSTLSRIEPRFSAAASTLAGKPGVEVRCWSQPDWSGLDDEWRAWTGTGLLAMKGYTRKSQPGTIHVSPLVCARLVAFTYSKWRPTKRNLRAQEDLAEALGVLAHEAQHSAGILDEATAECFGQQRIRPLARALGGSKDYAAVLAGRSWRDVYPDMPAAYQSPECRDGRALDLNPLAPIWP